MAKKNKSPKKETEEIVNEEVTTEENIDDLREEAIQEEQTVEENTETPVEEAVPAEEEVTPAPEEFMNKPEPEVVVDPPKEEPKPTVSVPTDLDTTAPEAKPVKKPKSVKRYRCGAPVDLFDEPIYPSSNSKNPKKFLTGRYYIFDGEEKNGSYRITDSKLHVKKDLRYVIGFIKK